MHSCGREQRSIFLQVRLLLIFLGRLNEEKNLDMSFHQACKPEAMVLVDEGVPVVLLFSFLLRKCDRPIH